MVKRNTLITLLAAIPIIAIIIWLHWILLKSGTLKIVLITGPLVIGIAFAIAFLLGQQRRSVR
ncbi:hypothetical protein J4526_01820 [Desulfurococcaceae archaeon MEX13E-LK6-19]|nr:hypothetical protein J4526_01820 [Desulfurococcaceae archaeon MEX13E-LK6-19]